MLIFIHYDYAKNEINIDKLDKTISFKVCKLYILVHCSLPIENLFIVLQNFYNINYDYYVIPNVIICR